jgi:hypothetical protein
MSSYQAIDRLPAFYFVAGDLVRAGMDERLLCNTSAGSGTVDEQQ